MEDAISSHVVIIVHTQLKVAEKAEADLLRNDTLIVNESLFGFLGEACLAPAPKLSGGNSIHRVEDVLSKLISLL